jgi:RNA polymerase sigma-70 factor (ECF subfamily)
MSRRVRDMASRDLTLTDRRPPVEGRRPAMARDAAEFDEFYRATSRRVLRYGYAVTGDLTEAQDVVQEAYTRAWRDWRRLERHPAPEAWVRLVVTRLATDRHRRRAGWLRAVVRTGPPPESTGPPGEDTVLLTAALRRLPPAQRQALALHYLFDLSIAEIARETGAAEGTVKSWLSRGRAALAAELGAPSADRGAKVLEVNDVE